MLKGNTRMRHNNLMFWSWNGDMEPNEIKRQIKSFKEIQAGGFFIHARAGLKIPYMQYEWFNAIQIAIDTAEECGLEVWLYDENGWPSGFAGGKVPKYGEDVWVKTLHFGFELPKGGVLIARYRQEGKVYVKDDNGGLFAYYLQDKHYVDLLHPNTVKYFLDTTHEIYKRNFGRYFGNVIKGIFTDEPQLPCGLVWSTILEEEFRKAYGEDLIGQLWKFFCPSEYTEFRYDFYRLISDLFEKRFTQPIARWCSENNLVMTGHFSSEESLCMQTVMSGGVARNYEFMQMPGIDHLGRKFISSVALRQLEGVKNQLGIKNTLSETFGCTGWGVSFPQLCAIWTRQAFAGINRACLHLAAYTIKGVRKRDYPTHFSYQEPWWEKFHLVSNWMENLNDFLSEGRPKNRVGVISAFSGCLGEEFFGTKQRYISNQFRLLIENLEECQIDFEVIDEVVLKRHGSIKNGKLCVGDSIFDYVIVSDMGGVISETADILFELGKSKGEIVFCNQYPTRINGRITEKVKKLSTVSKYDTIQNRADLWRKFFESKRYCHNVMIRSPLSEKLSKNVLLAVRYEKDIIRCAIFNTSLDHEIHAEFCALGEGSVIEYDLTTKKYINCLSEQKCDYSCSAVRLKPYECKCYIFKKGILNTEKKYLENIQDISFQSVKLGENTFTLDYVRILEEGQNEYSKKVPVTILHDKLNEIANSLGREVAVKIKYEFQLSFNPSVLDLVWEYADCRTIWVNNNKLESETDAWWLDRCMKRIPIAHCLHIGLNEIVMEYLISPVKFVENLEDVYETAKNKFSYQCEPEAVYLVGCFDVMSHEISKRFVGLRTNGDFKLIEATAKDPSRDLTEQGAWFYRGKAIYEASFEGTADEVYVEFENFYGAVVDIFVNEEMVGSIYTSSMRLNITSLTRKGENKLTAVLYSTNRNLLGPHHHYKDDPEFVGVNTFKGVQGYEDNVVNFDSEEKTWVDTYSFVFFGLGKCRILKKII